MYKKLETNDNQKALKPLFGPFRKAQAFICTFQKA